MKHTCQIIDSSGQAQNSNTRLHPPVDEQVDTTITSRFIHEVMRYHASSALLINSPVTQTTRPNAETNDIRAHVPTCSPIAHHPSSTTLTQSIIICGLQVYSVYISILLLPQPETHPMIAVDKTRLSALSIDWNFPPFRSRKLCFIYYNPKLTIYFDHQS